MLLGSPPQIGNDNINSKYIICDVAVADIWKLKAKGFSDFFFYQYSLPWLEPKKGFNLNGWKFRLLHCHHWFVFMFLCKSKDETLPQWLYMECMTINLLRGSECQKYLPHPPTPSGTDKPLLSYRIAMGIKWNNRWEPFSTVCGIQ